jgi:ketosteroid isomerase-like protein
VAEPSNTEIVERGYRAWNEDDLDGMLAVCHPEVEYHPSGVFPGMQPVYRGEEGIRGWWADFRGPWHEALRELGLD